MLPTFSTSKKGSKYSKKFRVAKRGLLAKNTDANKPPPLFEPLCRKLEVFFKKVGNTGRSFLFYLLQDTGSFADVILERLKLSGILKSHKSHY